MSLTIPPEGAYTDVELDAIDAEPPNLVPESQDSLWGQVRKLFCDYAQSEIRDQIDHWWVNLDPRLCNEFFLTMFEEMYGLPPSPDKDISLRRAFVLVRMYNGAWTRARRNSIIELFILPTFGQAIQFTPSGVAFDAGGIPFFSGVFDLDGTYLVIEDVEDFSYEVHILDSIDIDADGLTRELELATPAHLSFTVELDPELPEV